MQVFRGHGREGGGLSYTLFSFSRIHPHFFGKISLHCMSIPKAVIRIVLSQLYYFIKAAKKIENVPSRDFWCSAVLVERYAPECHWFRAMLWHIARWNLLVHIATSLLISKEVMYAEEQTWIRRLDRMTTLERKATRMSSARYLCI